MADEHRLRLRGTRDRVLDLLGFGETAPLRQVDVLDDKLKVPYGQTATVILDPAQPDVQYTLHHFDRSPIVVGEEKDEDGATHPVYLAEVPGTGGVTEIVTPPVTDELTYLVHGRKDLTDRSAYLTEDALVQVGLNLDLAARIVAPLLHDERSGDGHARIVDYGTKVTVQVDTSQEGVDYELVHVVDGRARKLSDGTVRGNLGTVELVSRKIEEDLDVRVRATKQFDESDTPEVGLLEIKLPLRVRADRAQPATAAPAIVEFATGGEIVVARSQPSVTYQLWMRPLTDDDVDFGGAEEGGDVVTVPVPGEAALRVRRLPADGEPVGLVEVGELRPGTGEDLALGFPPLEDDARFAITATKQHRRAPLDDGADPATIPSRVWLNAKPVVLAEPDRAPGLAITGGVADGTLSGELWVRGGQQGVFYSFAAEAGGKPIGSPAYFHREIEAEPRGIDWLRVGRDFVVAREPAQDEEAFPAAHPHLAVERAVALPATLFVRAVKARTRLAVDLDATVLVTAVPEIQADEPDIVEGKTARLVVGASIGGERYQPYLDGEPVRQARYGNGDDLVFVSEPLRKDALFVVHAATSADHPGIPVERRVRVPVAVWPPARAEVLADWLDPDKTGLAAPRIVDYGTAVDVRIHETDPEVEYRVVEVVGDAGKVVSLRPVAGNGGTIVLRTQRLTEDRELAIRVSRLAVVADGEQARQLRVPPLLPVAVRANRAAGAAAPGPPADFDGTGQVVIAEGQASVEYSVFGRAITDDDVVYGEPDGEVVAAEVADAPDVRVLRPDRPERWDAPVGFSRLGELVTGGDGELAIPVPGLTDDVLLVIRARKRHYGGVPSAVQLNDAVLLLVRPNPAPGLELAVVVADGLGESVTVTGGQPGVFYYLRQGEGAEWDPAAYVHREERGLEELRLGVDFVIAGAGEEQAPVLVPSRRLSLPVTLRARAVKARTRIDAQLTEPAEIPELPAIQPEQDPVANGSAARITVAASVDGERYQPFLAGAPVRQARHGNGGELVFVTEPVTGDTVFEVRVSRPDAPGIPVERRLAIPVTVTAE